MAAKKTKKSGKQASTSKRPSKPSTGRSSKRSSGRSSGASKRGASKAKPKTAPPRAKPKSPKAKRSPAKAKAKSAPRKAHQPKAKSAPAKSARLLSKPKKAPPSVRNGGRARPSRSSIEAGPTELDTIKLAYLFRDTTPADIFRALMDTAEHSAFTGDLAEIDARVGGEFRSYSGFIYGTTLELVPGARIVQSWRTKHFPENNPSSTLELTITPVAEGSRLDMRHLGVPKDQVEYIVTGWVKHYLDPLAKYLGRRVSVRPPAG